MSFSFWLSFWCRIKRNLGVAAQRMGSFLNCASHCSKSCQDVLLETLKQKTPVSEYHIECNHQFRPGQEVILNSSLLLDQNKEYSGAVMLIRDATRLLLLERELKDKYKFHALVGKSKNTYTNHLMLIG